jgi:hypothetical protein
VSRRAAARKSKSKSERLPVPEWVRALPWALLLRAAVLIGRRWHALSAKDRARLARLLRDSRGRASNLSTRERVELRKLLGRLQLRGLAGELIALGRRGCGRRGCRRRARA